MTPMLLGGDEPALPNPSRSSNRALPMLLPSSLLVVSSESPLVDSVASVLPGIEVQGVASADEALPLLRSGNLAVLLSDLHVDGGSGLRLCEWAARLSPQTVRMLVVRRGDAGAAELVDRGVVMRTIARDTPAAELRQTLKMAFELHAAERRGGELRRQLLSANDAMVAARAEVAHELSNQLQPLAMHAEVLHRKLTTAAKGLSDPVAGELLAKSQLLVEQHEQMVRVCQSMLGTSPPVGQSDALEVAVSLTAMLRELLGKVTLVIEGDGNAMVPLPAAALAQVLLNLLLNAKESIERRPGPGTVRVAVSSAPHLEIEIEDDGVGVASENRERIFHSRFSTRQEGNGLGLAVVRRIVVESGGEIRALGRHDGSPGARFLLRWPRH